MKVVDLCKTFESPVLVNFNAEFQDGRITCITGPSGCGKTTLLRLLMGLIKPDSGKIEGVPDKIAAMFQQDRLCEDFTALTNVCLVGIDRKAALENLERLGLADECEKPVSLLSGGQRRRVALCRAMLADADAVFLDEPFTGLDPELRGTCAKYISDTAEGRTVLLVTHDNVMPPGSTVFEMR